MNYYSAERLIGSLCDCFRVLTDCRALAEVVVREHTAVHQNESFGPAAAVRLLQSLVPAATLRATAAGLRMQCTRAPRFEDRPYPQHARLALALAVTAAVNQSAVVVSLEGAYPGPSADGG
ncbi:MAG: hypothetical protein QM740_21380 [Acidovorax sp.]